MPELDLNRLIQDMLQNSASQVDALGKIKGTLELRISEMINIFNSIHADEKGTLEKIFTNSQQIQILTLEFDRMKREFEEMIEGQQKVETALKAYKEATEKTNMEKEKTKWAIIAMLAFSAINLAKDFLISYLGAKK